MSAASLSNPSFETMNDHDVLGSLWDANTTRYLSAAGLVILIYDHILTFGDELRLVWAASPSFAKYAFLFNRYLVLGCLVVVAHEMCGFVGQAFTDNGCVHVLYTTGILSLCSVGIANILVLMRVAMLWEYRQIIWKLMVAGFTISFSIQIGMMLWTLQKLKSGVRWNVYAGMCETTTTSRTFIVVWASPMLFEVLVLFLTFVNALDRPRQAGMSLRKALHRDGIAYFMAVTAFRILNLTLSTVARPSVAILAVYFVWAMTTMISNRSLLYLRQLEIPPRLSVLRGHASPFGSKLATDSDDRAESPTAIELETLRGLSCDYNVC